MKSINNVEQVIKISIHALREESDSYTTVNALMSLYFNPRSP